MIILGIKNFFRELANSKEKGILFIFILVFLGHINIFTNQFVLDDYDFIVDWPLIQSWNNLPKFFFGYTPPLGQEGIYSPVKTVFHALNYQLFGNDPVGYHVVSLLIHFFGIYLVYAICALLSKNNRIAFMGSLLFALHPVQVEAITYMTASVDMIGIVFLFTAFLYYLKQDQILGKGRGSYALSILFAGLAIFTHELAISLPLLFLLYEFCLSKKRNNLFKKAFVVFPVFLIVAVYAMAKYQVFSSFTRGTWIYDSFYLTALVMIKVFAKYVLLVLFPIILTHNHVISKGIYSFMQDDFDKYYVLSQSFFDWQVLASLVIIIGLLLLALRWHKKDPLLTFCIGWFFFSLLPVSNIIPSGVLFGERYLYPGLLGAGLLAGYLLEKLINVRKKTLGIDATFLVGGIMVLLVSFYFFRTLIRNADWRDEISIMQSAVKANPHSALMRNDLGIIYTQYGEYKKAIESFDEALALREDPVTYFAKADAYTKLNNYKEAIAALDKAILAKTDYPEAYYNLAGIYAYLGENEKVGENISKSIYYYQQQGRNEEAQQNIKAFGDHFGFDINVKEVER